MKVWVILTALQLILSPLSIAAETTSNEKTAVKQAPVPPPTPGNANSVALTTNPGYDKNSQKSGGFEFYGKQGLSIANAIIGSNIISECSFGLKLLSIRLFWAGTIAYIASEIDNGGKSQNKDHNKNQAVVDETALMLTKTKGGGDGDVQRETIEKRLQDEIRTSKLVDDRIQWLTIVRGIYLAAAAAALMEEATGKAGGSSAGAGVCTGLAAKYAAMECAGRKDYPACFAKKFKKHMGKCTGDKPKGWARTLPNFYRPDSVPISYSACGGLYAAACSTYLSVYLARAYANCSPMNQRAVIAGLKLSTIITGAYSMAINATDKNKVATNITMMFGLLQYFIPSLAQKILPAYNYPIPRAATFTALAALVSKIISGLNDRQQNIIRPNIQKLTRVRDAFLKDTNDSTGYTNHFAATEAAPVSKIDFNANEQKKGETSAYQKPGTTSDKSGRKICVANSDNEVQFGESSCSNPMTFEKTVIPDANIPEYDSLKKADDISNKFVNEINKGNLEEAKVIASEFNDLGKAIRDTNVFLEKSINAERIAEDEADINFEAVADSEIAKFDDEFATAVNQNEKFTALAKEFQIPNASDAAMKNNSISSLSLDTQKAGTETITPPLIAAPATPSATAASSSSESKNASDPAIQGGSILDSLKEASYAGESALSEDEKFKLAVEDQRSAKANGYQEFEDRMEPFRKKGEDISPLSDYSLFKQISYRYHKSLDKILTRKKSPEETANSQVKKTNTRQD